MRVMTNANLFAIYSYRDLRSISLTNIQNRCIDWFSLSTVHSGARSYFSTAGHFPINLFRYTYFNGISSRSAELT